MNLFKTKQLFIFTEILAHIPEMRAAILAHHHHELSGRIIVEKLENDRIFSSKNTINLIFERFYSSQSGVTKPTKRLTS
jgi:predicted transcriptional regulator YheO